MKTFLAVFTEEVLNRPSYKYKRYAFNTDNEDIKVGDYIKCSSYHVPIQVTRIIPHPKKWYDNETGKLTNKPANPESCTEIKKINILDPAKEQSIVGYKKRVKR